MVEEEERELKAIDVFSPFSNVLKLRSIVGTEMNEKEIRMNELSYFILSWSNESIFFFFCLIVIVSSDIQVRTIH